MHNYLINRQERQHVRSDGWDANVNLAVPSQTDGDALGEAIDDPRYATTTTLPSEQLPGHRSGSGVSVLREALLASVIAHDLERPMTSRRRHASDSVL